MKVEKKYLIYVFDIDGTISDSKLSIIKALEETLLSFGISYERNKLRSTIGLPLKEVFKKLGIKERDLQKAYDKYRNAYYENISLEAPFEGITEVIEILKKNGCYLSVVTNKGLNGTERILSDYGILRYFDILITPDNAFPKPSPDGWEKIKLFYEQEKGIFISEKDAIMIGDSEWDAEFARNSNITFGFAGWGYYDISDLQYSPDYIFNTPQSLKDFITNTVLIEWTTELDLHTYNPRELERLLSSYLTVASDKGWKVVRIIHGKGKGILKARVRKLLKNSKNVGKFYDAPSYLGGFGATIVELKNIESEINSHE